MRILILFFVLVAQLSYADCEKKIFSCQFNNQKQVEVFDSKGNITYRFGKNLAKPELQFSLPHQQTQTTQWQGFGSNDYDDLRLTNKGVTYVVFHRYNKIEENPNKRIEAGIQVIIKKKVAAQLLCQPKTISNHLYDLDYLPPVSETE